MITIQGPLYIRTDGQNSDLASLIDEFTKSYDLSDEDLGLVSLQGGALTKAPSLLSRWAATARRAPAVIG